MPSHQGVAEQLQAPAPVTSLPSGYQLLDEASVLLNPLSEGAPSDMREAVEAVHGEKQCCSMPMI